jgi:hypothetical protein
MILNKENIKKVRVDDLLQYLEVHQLNSIQDLIMRHPPYRKPYDHEGIADRAAKFLGGAWDAFCVYTDDLTTDSQMLSVIQDFDLCARGYINDILGIYNIELSGVFNFASFIYMTNETVYYAAVKQGVLQPISDQMMDLLHKRTGGPATDNIIQLR